MGAYQPSRTPDIKSNHLKALIKMFPGNSFVWYCCFFAGFFKNKKSVVAEEKLQDYFEVIASDIFARRCLCIP